MHCLLPRSIKGILSSFNFDNYFFYLFISNIFCFVLRALIERTRTFLFSIPSFLLVSGLGESIKVHSRTQILLISRKSSISYPEPAFLSLGADRKERGLWETQKFQINRLAVENNKGDAI
jgi:hypothetical protein